MNMNHLLKLLTNGILFACLGVWFMPMPVSASLLQSGAGNPVSMRESAHYQIPATPQPTRIRRRAATGALRGLSFTSGGAGGSIRRACSGGDQIVTGRFGENVLQPNDIVTVSVGSSQQSGMSYTDIRSNAFPAICVLVSEFTGYAISPDGTQYPPLLWKAPVNEVAELDGSFEGWSIQLPIEAYAQPGVWHLGVNAGDTFEFQVEVTQPDSTALLYDGSQFLLAGFQPSENIVGVFYEGGGADFVGDIQLTATQDGYALFTLPEEDLFGYYGYLFIGERGSAMTDGWFLPLGGMDLYWGLDDPRRTDGMPRYPHLDDQLTAYEAVALLNHAYWNNSPLLRPEDCPGFMPSRLHIGMRGYVSDPSPSPIQQAPDALTTVGQIPSGSIFSVVSGPVCGSRGNMLWWEVEYNGMRGWVAEGEGDIYRLAQDDGVTDVFLDAVVVVRPDDPLNVRTGPGTNYPVIDTLPMDTVVELYGRNQASTWVVISPFEQRWVSTAFLNVLGQVTTLPIKSQSFGE